jgi:exodeoxyribonuclease VII large subunit
MPSLELFATPDVYSVATLTAEIQRLLSRNFEGIRVAGEISGWKVWSSGHAYFTLKDQQAQIRCVLFRNQLRYLRLEPRDGLAVVARGSVEVRAERGEYQLIVSGLDLQGVGRLYELFEKLKAKLQAEGLFDAARKRPLPPMPQRIGIVTSPRGAVIRDMLSVLRRRFPGLHIRLYPAQVQGPGSVDAIVAGLDYFSASDWAQVVIVGRGGGSIEDLWSFNDEGVARAIVACRVPVVSAVGSETDYTIADFVADLRAPTPSAAAELIVPERDKLLAAVQLHRGRARQAMRYRLSRIAHRLEQRGLERATRLLQQRIHRGAQRVDEAAYSLQALWRDAAGARQARLEALDKRLKARDLRLGLARAGERLRVAERALRELMPARLASARARLEPPAAQLAALSPLRVLERGYAIVETESGTVVRRAADAPPGTLIGVRLHRGRLVAHVQDSRE